MLDDTLPSGHGNDGERLEQENPSSGRPNAGSSLAEDIAALIDDGKTYVEAEIAFQKTRLAFTVDRGKSGLLLGACAFAVLHLALVALVFGSILALTPVITAWGATALVTGLLVILGVILGVKANKRVTELAEAYQETNE